MRRFALALAVAVLPPLTLAMTQTKELPPPAAGLWHLLQKDDEDEQNIPEHRVDVRLYPAPPPFRAAMVNRVTGDEIPYPVASFDGRTLKLQTGAHGKEPLPGDGWLQMTWDGLRFEGTYVGVAGQPLTNARPLKLIRARSQR